MLGVHNGFGTLLSTWHQLKNPFKNITPYYYVVPLAQAYLQNSFRVVCILKTIGEGQIWWFILKQPTFSSEAHVTALHYVLNTAQF